jgi:hypothetical protein
MVRWKVVNIRDLCDSNWEGRSYILGEWAGNRRLYETESGKASRGAGKGWVLCSEGLHGVLGVLNHTQQADCCPRLTTTCSFRTVSLFGESYSSDCSVLHCRKLRRMQGATGPAGKRIHANGSASRLHNRPACAAAQPQIIVTFYCTHTLISSSPL